MNILLCIHYADMIFFTTILCVLASLNRKLQNAIVNGCQVSLNRYARNIEISRYPLTTYSKLLRQVAIKINECLNHITGRDIMLSPEPIYF